MISLVIALGCAFVAADAGNARPDPAVLAHNIDQHLASRFAAERVTPAPLADDAEFLRRLYLDLVGRIPTAAEAREFLADTDAAKRDKLIDRLLASPGHADYLSHVWWCLLVPESETEPQVRYFESGFRAWLKQRFREGAGLDAIARELVSVPIAGPGQPADAVLRDFTSPNMLGFYAAKDAEAPKIASSTLRVFLGIRLECAQCHNHPYDTWTQEQFWNQAAIFAGIERRGKGFFAPLLEDPKLVSISPMETKGAVPAVLLGQSPEAAAQQPPTRADLARWMTSSDNAYFAKAMANRVWDQLMGLGIVAPVDDFRASNPPSHPELLATLADAFKTSGYDMNFLQAAICRSEAYQRTSRQTDASQGPAERFAKMPIKPLSAEQFYASLAQVTDHQPPRVSENRMDGEPEMDRLRSAVKKIVAEPQPSGDPQTSVAQALALMNGDTVNRAVKPRTGTRLAQVIKEFPDEPERQVEALYLWTLSRYPTAAEKKTLADFQSDGDASARLGDIFWMLLNLPEFRWNH